MTHEEAMRVALKLCKERPPQFNIAPVVSLVKLADAFGFDVVKRAASPQAAAASASAVQPERCCLDYPRCDCNSPPEPAQEPKGCNHFPGQVNCEWCTEVPHE